jgi:hypothetical protein
MKIPALLLLIALLSSAPLLAEESSETLIQRAMKLAHKAPKGIAKLGEKIVDGTASDDEVKKVLEAYLAAADSKPPKGDAAEFKKRWSTLVAATQDVAAKKEGAAAAYKEAVACKACHNEHKEQKQ